MTAAGGAHVEPVGGRGEVVSAEKRGERARDIIASSFCYTLCWASHFTGPPLVCSPHPTKKGRLTSLRRGEGLTAVVPGRRERKERKVEAVVVVGDREHDRQRILSVTLH